MGKEATEIGISDAVLEQAQVIARLSYCNPFGPERVALEREALGNAFRAGRIWNESYQQGQRDPNIAKLTELAGEHVTAFRAAFTAGREVSDAISRTYVDLVYFHLFHKYQDQFDALIHRSEQASGDGLTVRFYEPFAADYAAAFSAGSRFSEEVECAHAFAVMYQLQPAFYYIFRFLVGSSVAMTQLREAIWESVFSNNMARYRRLLYARMGEIVTLITGRSGTGKELVARAIGLSRFVPFDARLRQFAVNSPSAFYPVNLAALSPTLIESELFGHRKGAFTGANQPHTGYFETCGELGTIFLDEIGEISPDIQVKLLRVLQSRQFQRLGETRLQPFAGKVIAATNRDLAKEIDAGTFREDFYYRICADLIRTPSLRAVIGGDWRQLETLVAFACGRAVGDDEGPALTDEVMSYVRVHLGLDYPWPGNFRELEQVVRNILVHGSYTPARSAARQGVATTGDEPSLREILRGCDLTSEELTATYIAIAYARYGTYEEVGRRLSIDRRTVKKYLEKAGEFEVSE